MSRWRIVVALAVLGVFAAALVWLAPIYLRHYQLERAVDRLMAEPGLAERPPELIQVAVAARAAAFGIPVKPEQVRVGRSSGRLDVDIRYFVRLDLPIYTVDLHFRVRSRSR